MARLLETTDTAYHIEQDGRRLILPRVTAVLSLVRDFSKIAPETLEHAAMRGRAVHRAVWLAEGQGDGSGLDWSTLHPELVPYVEAYQAAKRALRFTVIGAEMLVSSAVFGFAGRVDLLVEWRGRCGVLDLKTGEPHPAHRLQVSAYVEAWKETTASRRRMHRWILYLKSTGGYKLDECATGSCHEADFKVFTQLLAGWNWKEAQKL